MVWRSQEAIFYIGQRIDRVMFSERARSELSKGGVTMQSRFLISCLLEESGDVPREGERPRDPR